MPLPLSPRLLRRGLPCTFEGLESRTLFSAPYEFAAVGVRYDAEGGPAVFLTEGTIGEDSGMTGATRLATLAGAADTPLDWTSLVRGERGGMSFGTRDGFTPYASQYGTQFLRDERWTTGSFVGRDAQGRARDLAVLGQVYFASDFADAAFGEYDLQMTRLTDTGGVETFSLEILYDPFFASPDEMTFTYHLASGDVTVTKSIAGYADGRATFETGETLILLDEQNAVVLADLDSADGIVGVASGRVIIMQTELQAPARWYRGAIAAAGSGALGFLGVDPGQVNAAGVGVADVVIQLTNRELFFDAAQAPSTYVMYDAADWDAGVRTVVTSGTWSTTYHSNSPIGALMPRIDFATESGDRLEAWPGGSHELHVSRFVAAGGAADPLWGVLSQQQARPGSAGEYLVETDAAGRPIVYHQNWEQETPRETTLFSIDLILEAGGEAIVGEPIVWQGTGNNARYYSYIAGVSASGDVLLWERFQDAWSFTNLTDTVQGARPITGLAGSTIYATSHVTPGEQFLAGYDTDGNLVVYHQGIVTQPAARPAWEFVDVELDGLDGAGTLPAGLSSLSGWTVGWNAGHFAGVDSNGELWSIWWAPGMERWRVDSLSDLTGGPVLVGAPTSLATSWGTFHISGTNADGALIVTWWSMQHGWLAQNLTADFNGPALEAGSLVSEFNQASLAINIVGIDAAGDAQVYWWGPPGAWQFDTPSAGIQVENVPMEPRRFSSAAWRSTIGPTFFGVRSQSLLGQNTDGDLVRLIWRDDRGPTWALENVTDVSTPYFV